MKEYNLPDSYDKFSSDILIGENRDENDLLLKISDKSHYWFHLESFPSCHLIFKNNLISNREALFCAKLCLDHTKYKNMRNIYVCYTTINNLKRISPGEVEFISNKKVNKILL